MRIAFVSPLVGLASRPMLQPGDKAPDFALPDQNSKLVKLSDLREQTVILYFYPRADTPGCTTQACGVRDRSDEYAKAGARVIGVSPDEPEKIKKFDDKYGLGFTLLGDVDHKVAEKYGAWGEKSMYGKKYMGMLRSTFIIDPKGKIARVFPKVQPKKHDALVLKALGELADA
jgi:peroxiredoxin Q/BCP